MSSSDAIVSVEGVVKSFRPGLGLRPKRVLHGISFEVQDGEIFGFVGPNGAGKTTTLKVLMGLIHPDGGRASVLGNDVGETAYRRAIGFLPENPYFYDFLTGAEFLDFFAKLAGVPASERPARVKRLLEEVGLSHAADARLRTYSKGMLQRAGIAQAIIHDPSIVFLDEPMSGLDPIGRKEIRDLILRLNAAGKTIFMNTHILSDVEVLCHRVAIIVKGRICFEGSPHDVVESGELETDVVVRGIDPAAAQEIEQRFDARMSGRDDHIEFRVAEKHASELLQQALGAGAQVYSVLPHRSSLEHLFLEKVEEAGPKEAE